VRQGFLLNTVDMVDGEANYRNEWIQRRLLFLADVFAIDLMSFAIMDNHTHLVLYANLDLAKQWSNTDVLNRWSKLGELPILCQLYLDPQWRDKFNDVELTIVLEQIDAYRQKLTDISIFMSRFNYYVAKRANKEDRTSGHFWEARFKSQALLDSEAVLSCMFYVDLNPIRARKAKTLHDSHFTSIKYRLSKAVNESNAKLLPIRHYHFNSSHFETKPMTLQNYVSRLQSLISPDEELKHFATLNKFSQDSQLWRNNIDDFENMYSISAGKSELVALFNEQARHSVKQREIESQMLFDTILGRLRDLQYHAGKMNPCN
jgi:hypothetical protein